MSEGHANKPGKLEGTWSKVGSVACAEKYPATITFSVSTYRGSRAPDQGMVWWDAGIYRIEGADALVISTATDELVTYRVRFEGDEMHLIDPEGCQFAYRRESRRRDPPR